MASSSNAIKRAQHKTDFEIGQSSMNMGKFAMVEFDDYSFNIMLALQEHIGVWIQFKVLLEEAILRRWVGKFAGRDLAMGKARGFVESIMPFRPETETPEDDGVDFSLGDPFMWRVAPTDVDYTWASGHKAEWVDKVPASHASRAKYKELFEIVGRFKEIKGFVGFMQKAFANETVFRLIEAGDPKSLEVCQCWIAAIEEIQSTLDDAPELHKTLVDEITTVADTVCAVTGCRSTGPAQAARAKTLLMPDSPGTVTAFLQRMANALRSSAGWKAQEDQYIDKVKYEIAHTEDIDAAKSADLHMNNIFVYTNKFAEYKDKFWAKGTNEVNDKLIIFMMTQITEPQAAPVGDEPGSNADQMKVLRQCLKTWTDADALLRNYNAAVPLAPSATQVINKVAAEEAVAKTKGIATKTPQLVLSTEFNIAMKLLVGRGFLIQKIKEECIELFVFREQALYKEASKSV